MDGRGAPRPRFSSFEDNTVNVTTASLFDDQRSTLLFFSLSVLPMTLGNGLMILLIGHVSESQFAVLKDHLECHLYALTIFVNLAVFVFGTTLALTVPSSAVCAVFTVVLKPAQFSLILTFSLITVTRILYITQWKNVGALNDGFFLFFARALNALCVILFSGWLTVFRKYKGFPDYIVCVGDANPDPELAFDPIDLAIRFLVVVGVCLRVILVKERRKLEELHMTKDARGLPRLGDTHPGLEQVKTYTVMAGLLIVAIVCRLSQLKFLASGHVWVFPYSAAYFMVMWYPGIFISLFLPSTILSHNEKVKQYCKRKVAEALQDVIG